MTMEPGTMPDTAATPEGAQKEHRGRKRWLLLLLLLSLLGGTFFVWTYYLTGRQSISKVLPAGQAIAKGLKPHYLFSIYGVEEPVGVAVSPEGNRIYVAESGGERLIKAFDREGKSLGSFAPPNTPSAGRAPLYIALNRAGQVYVTDRIRHAIDVYDAGGNYQSSVKPPIAEAWSPMGVRFNGEYLLITDLTSGKHRVLEMNKDGALTFMVGREGHGDGPDELWFPNSAVMDALGRVYVSDSNNSRVQIFDSAGSLLDTIPGFALPRGLALDAEQRLYVVDAVDHKVKVFDVSKDKDKPKSLFNFGDLGSDDGEFQFPNDIALDQTDRLYIADRVNNRIQVWVY